MLLLKSVGCVVTRNRAINLLLGVFALAVLGGCQSAGNSGAMTLPHALISVAHYYGTPLSGPQVVPANTTAADALDVRVDWFALEQADVRSLPLLGSQARLVTAQRGGLAVMPAAKFTSDARVQWIAPDAARKSLAAMSAGPMAAFGKLRTALPHGVNASFSAVDLTSVADDTLGQLRQPRVEIDISRPAAVAGVEQLQVGVAVEDFSSLAEAHGATTQPGNASRLVFQREVALLDHPFDQKPIAALIAVPFEFTQTSNHWVVAVVTIAPAGNDPAFAALLAQCQTDLKSSGIAAVSSTQAADLVQAVDLLGNASRRRATLVYLAGESGAALCEDTVLVADDALLAHLAAAVEHDAKSALASGDLAGLGWRMDRAAIFSMLPLLDKATLPDELSTVLTLHLGEPGRHAAALDEVMQQATSRDDLDRRLIAENYIYLEDSSPAARVRAFDWLKAHQQAPAGFDPLASPKQRRLALDQALSTGSGGGK
jgi:hypothetical protein